ncbi:MAG: lasso peptide biosynthesis protein [Desulfomonile sp.]|nr:lasso peptide biosynthesis protein [Desulfomonile sp.]
MKSFPTTSRLRPSITIVFVCVWLALMGILVKDRYRPAAAVDATAARISAVESEDWFTIRIKGAYAGFGRSRQMRSEDRWVLQDEVNISLNIQGQTKPVRIAGEAVVDDDFRLVSFSMRVNSGIISFEQTGRMEGRDLLLSIPESKGGGTKRIRLYERPRISRSLGLPVPLTGLQVGDEFTMPIFDPLDGTKSEAEITVLEKADIEVAGKKVEGWRVRAAFRSMQLSVWIDGEGRLLKGVMPLGITVTRSSKTEISQRMPGVKDLPEMTSLAAVPLEGALPPPSTLDRLVLDVLSVGDVGIPTVPHRQEYSAKRLNIRREAPPHATYALPFRDRSMEADLAASRFIRSDHPDIVAKAGEIVGTETNPVAAARRINEWVHNHLKKVPTPSLPDAVTILQSGEGDCNEHAVLAAALARAVGLPARVALGLVFMEDAFYYHAWVEYWAGASWFTGDPLMNQLPVDPSHVTLLYGDVDKHVNVLNYLGRLKLRVVKAF